MLIFVLDEVDSLDDVDVMESGGNAELGCQLLDILLLRLVLSPFSELLSGCQLEHIYAQAQRRTLTAYSFSSVRSHLCARRTTDVAPFPMATFSQTPYFFSKLIVLSPAVDLRSLSESDFLLLAVERPDVLRVSFGPPSSLFKSLRVNFCPVSDCEWIEPGREGGFDAGFDDGASFVGCRAVRAKSGSGVLADWISGAPDDEVGEIRKAGDGATSFCDGTLISGCKPPPSLPPETPEDILGALLGGWVEGRLQLSLSEAESEPLLDGVIEPVVEDESRWMGREANTSLSEL